MSLSDTTQQQGSSHSDPSPKSPDYFFAGAGRGEILADILKNLAHDATILIITGDEGSGKTTLCRLVEQQLPANHIPIVFPATLESFEEVIRLIGRRLGIDTGELTKAKIPDLLVEIRRILRQDNTRLVLFFDQAEQIFLATLERIRKMLDFLNEEGDTGQFVFAGQSLLLNNLRQLRIVSFREAVEKEYVLSPLSLADTAAFLKGAFEKDAKNETGASVPKDVVAGVHAEAGGNLAKTVALAQQARQKSGQDASFWVLLENIQVKEQPKGLTSIKKWLPAWPKWSWRLPSPGPAIGRIQGWFSLAWLAKLTLPKLAFPKITLPKLTLPKLTLPKITLPKFALPKISLPDGRLIWRESALRRWLCAWQWETVKKRFSALSPPRPSARQLKIGGALVLACILTTGLVMFWPAKKIEPPTVPDGEVASVVADVGEPIEKTPPGGEASGGPGAESGVVDSSDGENDRPPASGEILQPREPSVVTQGAVDEKSPESSGPSRQVNPEQPQVADSNSGETQVSPSTQADLPPVQVDSGSAAQEPSAALVDAKEQDQAAEQETSLSPEVRAIAESVRQQKERLDSSQNEPPKTAPSESLPVRDETTTSAAVKNSQSVDKPVAAEINVVNIVATKHKKVLPVHVPEPEPEPEPAAKVITAVAEKTVPATKVITAVPKVQAVQADSGDTLFKKRLAAGERWKKQTENNRYTVQLLSLNSADAEKKLKEMLAQEGYKEHADKLTIVRKSGSTNTVALFYGDYSTMTDARNARNTIPSSLRKHNPYAISVDGALRKLGAR